VVDGVTFALYPGTLYAPTRDLAAALGWPLRWEGKTGKITLNEVEVSPGAGQQLVDGTTLMSVRALEEWGAAVAWDAEAQAARLTHNGTEVQVRSGRQRVVINREEQRMRAWQGDLLVLDTRVSTGRRGMPTPTGCFNAGPLKRPLLISRKYNNARMPWSVQIAGDYVIHGFHSVPPRAASHGCVRVPLTGGNPARWFYQWVEIGTPIVIQDGWPRDSAGYTRADSARRVSPREGKGERR
jgi:lipoprotein-anchoring transpeptidase ErfK/SrfK